MTSVLISGAGVAGPTLAYFLARQGLDVAVVERSEGLRSSGNPVDVRGPALPVAERMGVLPHLREVATTATAMSVRDAAGREVTRVRMSARTGEVELPRGDLAATLYGAVRDDAEFLFDDTVVALDRDAGGVDVTFDRAAPRRFDLVVGADGLHSAVRRLAFGPERDFVHHLGVYVATMPLGGPAEHPTDVIMYNTPGRLVSIHPARGNALVAFIFRAPAGDHGDPREFITRAYAGVGWRVPELLDRVRAAPDLYFDSVSNVQLPSWSRGRVALLGDAASCVSLFGDGSSLAMAGAFTLAEAFADNVDTAFAQYEVRHRRLTNPKRRRVGRAAALIVPKTRFGIALRNAAARLAPAGA